MFQPRIVQAHGVPVMAGIGPRKVNMGAPVIESAVRDLVFAGIEDHLQQPPRCSSQATDGTFVVHPQQPPSMSRCFCIAWIVRSNASLQLLQPILLDTLSWMAY